LIGEAAAQFAQTLEGEVSYERCETIDTATKRAWQDARQSDTEETIILSPACASFDQFPDFEARGRHFTACVKELLNLEHGVSTYEEPAALTA
jgi:UDP-N-acetylmuramoylalanine--D-glutamate ligase